MSSIYKIALNHFLGTADVIVVRGLPGSGKSLFALNLQNHVLTLLEAEPGLSFANRNVFVLELDHLFLDKNLNYKFEENRYEWAKKDVLYRAIRLNSFGYNIIIPDVFPTVSEISKYGHPLVITLIDSHKDIHCVSKTRLQEFKDQWEPYPFEIFVKYNPQTKQYEVV